MTTLVQLGVCTGSPNSVGLSSLSFEFMVWHFIGVYIINRTLHGRLEIRNFSSIFITLASRNNTQKYRFMMPTSLLLIYYYVLLSLINELYRSWSLQLTEQLSRSQHCSW